LQAAFKHCQRALFQILAGNFGQPSEKHKIVEFGFLLALVGVFIHIEPVGRQAEIGHLLAAGHHSDLRVARQSADKKNLI
jgi:hypothetical protein